MKRLLLLAVLSIVILPLLSAQNRTVSGTIKDASTNEVLPFASIHVPNTLVGTMSNEFGEFSLKLKQGRDTIQISYLGYLDEVMVIKEDEENLDISLKVWSAELEEVVVKAQGFEPLYYIKKAIAHYPNSVSGEPFETTAFYAEKTSILNNQSDAYELTEAVFNTYYQDFTDTTVALQNVLILERTNDVGEMKTMLERNKRLGKRMKKNSDEENDDLDKDSNKNTVSMDLSEKGPSDILSASQDVIESAFFDSEYFDKFKYTYGEPSYYKDRRLMVIHFKNKKKVEYMYYDGTVYLDTEDQSIVALKYNMRVKLPWFVNTIVKTAAGFKLAEIEVDISINNQELNNYWYPKELRKDFKIKLKQRSMDRKIEYETLKGQQVLNIYSIDTNNPTAVKKEQLFDSEKEYKVQVFNKNGVEWSDVNVVKFQ